LDKKAGNLYITVRAGKKKEQKTGISNDKRAKDQRLGTRKPRKKKHNPTFHGQTGKISHPAS
jgi:hypothetical protein